MNLLKKLQDEVKKLGLIDEYEIAYLIYIRTGEFFDYNPLYEVADSKLEKRLAKLREEKENVKNFYQICFTWASLYVDLLNSFGIQAKVIKNEKHAFVEFEANGHVFKADLMKNYEDIFRIKFGLPLVNFKAYGVIVDHSKIDEKIGYYKGIQLQECLKIVHTNLLRRNAQKDDYKFEVFKFIEKMLSFDRYRCGYISSRKFVDFILATFTDYVHGCINLVDLEHSCFTRLYSFYAYNQFVFFILREDEKGFYRFEEVFCDDLGEILKKYQLDGYSEVKFTRSDYVLKKLA